MGTKRPPRPISGAEDLERKEPAPEDCIVSYDAGREKTIL